MAKIIDLDTRRALVTARARCATCGYEWIAAYPRGAEARIECPGPGCGVRANHLVLHALPDDEGPLDAG